MKKFVTVSAFILALALVINVIPACAQGDNQAQAQGSQAVTQAQEGQAQQPAAEAPAAPAQEAAQPKDLSAYGEVQAVNTLSSSITVQYYDYDTDEEKTLEVMVGKDSKLENVTKVEEIKKGDWVDVTYSVTEGKNIAKLVGVEKEEIPAETSAQAPAAPATQ